MAEPTVEPIGLQLARTAKTASRAFDDELAEGGGSLPLWLVLVSLKGQAHGAQRQLAEAVGVEGPTLTHHLNRMEENGLVTRVRDPRNRRVHQVELTPRGVQEFETLLGVVQGFDRRLRAGLTASELTTLRELLRRLADHVMTDR